MSSILKGLNESKYRQYDTNRTGFTRGPRDDERHYLDVQQPSKQEWALKIDGKIWSKDGKTVTFKSKEAALNIRNSILKNRPDLEIGLVTRGGVAETEGNFVGDTPVNIGGATVKRLGVGDIVSYLGQKAKINAQSKDREYSRITILSDFGGITKDVLTSDLKRVHQGVTEEQLDEISNEKLAQYKTAAAADAKKADSEGDYKRGDKRFSGIVKATKKQFANDEKNVEEGRYDSDDYYNPRMSRDYGARNLHTDSGAYDFEKNVPAGEPGGERGRPSNLKGISKALPADAFGRTTGKIPKGKPGTVHSMMRDIDEEQLDELKCWPGHHRVPGTKEGAPGSCEKNKTNEEGVTEEKQRLDPKCWHNKKIGNPKTKMKGGVRVNNCVPKESNSNIFKGLQQVDESWRDKLGAAALTGAMALGAAGAQARVTPGDDPNINRLNGQPIATQQATTTAPTRIDSPSSPSGFSKEYLQKAADPNRFGRYMISVEKAQELLKQMNEEQLDEKWSQKYKDSINCSDPKGFSQKAHCAGKKK